MKRNVNYTYFIKYVITPPEFGGEWGTECRNTGFPLPTLLNAGYSVKLYFVFVRVLLTISGMRSSCDSRIGCRTRVPDGFRRLVEPIARRPQGAAARQGGGHGVRAQVHQRRRRLQGGLREDRIGQNCAEILLFV